MDLCKADPDMKAWSLGFIEDTIFFDELGDNDLGNLCCALRLLLNWFQPGKTIYVIIDSISSFDIDKLWNDLKLVIGHLAAIVEEPSIARLVKVLLTTPEEGLLRFRRLPMFADNPFRLVQLSDMAIDRVEISSYGLQTQLQHMNLLPVRGSGRWGEKQFRSTK